MYSYLLAYRIFVFLDTVLYFCIALSPRLPYLHRILNTKKNVFVWTCISNLHVVQIILARFFLLRIPRNCLRLVSGVYLHTYVYGQCMHVLLLSLHHSCIQLLKLLRFFLVFTYIVISKILVQALYDTCKSIVHMLTNCYPSPFFDSNA